jgi:AbrB family looped-hinge helix DNA binding protein
MCFAPWLWLQFALRQGPRWALAAVAGAVPCLLNTSAPRVGGLSYQEVARDCPHPIDRTHCRRARLASRIARHVAQDHAPRAGPPAPPSAEARQEALQEVAANAAVTYAHLGGAVVADKRTAPVLAAVSFRGDLPLDWRPILRRCVGSPWAWPPAATPASRPATPSFRLPAALRGHPHTAPLWEGLLQSHVYDTRWVCRARRFRPSDWSATYKERVMNVIVDPSGRIELPDVVRASLGLKSGDCVAIEEEDGRWVIKPVRAPEMLRWEGNVLVHDGVFVGAADVLEETRRERHDSTLKGDAP